MTRKELHWGNFPKIWLVGFVCAVVLLGGTMADKVGEV